LGHVGFIRDKKEEIYNNAMIAAIDRLDLVKKGSDEDALREAMEARSKATNNQVNASFFCEALSTLLKRKEELTREDDEELDSYSWCKQFHNGFRSESEFFGMEEKLANLHYAACALEMESRAKIRESESKFQKLADVMCYHVPSLADSREAAKKEAAMQPIQQTPTWLSRVRLGVASKLAK